MPEDGYPTEQELDTIRTWPCEKGFVPLMEFIKQCWNYADWGFSGPNRSYWYNISTAGWSGNEEIIYHMKKNFIFWSMCWVESRRGGHYKFYIPKGIRQPKTKKNS